jgi:hypothetical protein
MKTAPKRRIQFFAISAGMMDTDCYICHARPGKPIVLPKGVRLVCDDCSDKAHEAIQQQIIDVDLFHKKLAADRENARYLTGVRKLICDVNEKEPERELFCPVCGMETTIVSSDAVKLYPNPKAIDYIIGPYSAVCSHCVTFLRTIHPSPEAALDYWRDQPEALTSSR